MQQQQKYSNKQVYIKQVDIVSGVFPSFVYFPFKSTLFDQIYVKEIQDILIREKLKFQKLDNLHLSISKTFKLQEKQAKKFVQQLKTFFKVGQLPIVLIFESVEIIENFIVLKCAKVCSDKINEYTKRLNDFLIKHAFDPYFENPIFHISLFRIEYQDVENLKGQLKKIKVNKKGYSLSKILIKVGNIFVVVKGD